MPLRLFPEKQTPIEMIFKMISGDTDSSASVLSLIGLDTTGILKSLQAEVLNVPEMQVR